MERNEEFMEQDAAQAAQQDTAPKAQTEQSAQQDGAQTEQTAAESAEGQTEQTQTEKTPAEEAPKEEKGGFFKKKEDKEKTALKEKVAELEDRTKRQMAEFENFRKRSNKEKDQMFAMGEKNVVEKILPVVDNFERGLAAVPEAEKGTKFVEGMEMVYRQLMTQLEALGVKPIEAMGQEFDPNFHNAVMQVDSEEIESGKIAQELQKGYLYHDSVVRHSMVGVVK